MKKLDKLGWVVAAGLAGIMIGSGFQGGSVKIGTVDFGKVLDSNEHSKVSTAMLTKMKDSREEFLNFVRDHKTATTEQLMKLRTLSTKDKLTTAEEAELKKLKDDITRVHQNYVNLAQKPSLTTAEEATVREMGSRIRNNDATMQGILEELRRELDGKVQEQSVAISDKARETMADIGKAGGYTVIFDTRSAPYAANDLTEQAVKALNAKK